MHYYSWIIAEKDASEETLEKILAPYNEGLINTDETGLIGWDWYVLGGRWNDAPNAVPVKGYQWELAPAHVFTLDSGFISKYHWDRFDYKSATNDYKTPDREWNAELTEWLKQFPNGYIYVADIHS